MKLSIISTSQDWATPHLEQIDSTALHALYVADHPSFAVTDSWSWLAFAAARTQRILLGTHVAGAPFHHPTRLAKQVASVDVLSNGRRAAERVAHHIRDLARSWGRQDTVTNWGAGGVLHGDGDAMCEQLQRFAGVGCSEVTVAVSSIDDVRWLDEHVARPSADGHAVQTITAEACRCGRGCCDGALRIHSGHE